MQPAFFFYGTLMDREQLSRVLQRRVVARDLAPARLPGWRRVQAKGEPFAIVLPRRGALLPGMVLIRVRGSDEARLLAYEGPGYAFAAGVATSGERRRAVRFFVPRLGAYTPAHRDWDFVAWRRRRRT